MIVLPPTKTITDIDETTSLVESSRFGLVLKHYTTPEQAEKISVRYVWTDRFFAIEFLDDNEKPIAKSIYEGLITTLVLQ